jgi:ceramide glucosyltransferase
MQNMPVALILLLLFISSAIYNLLAFFSVIEFFRPEKKDSNKITSVPISILKPLSGRDPGLYDNIRSFCSQDYPEYEVILGVTDPGDAALATAEELKEHTAVKVIVSEKKAGSNNKVSNLNGLSGSARNPLLAISDSDMRVDSSYLKHIAGEYFSTENVGLVTSLYKISNPISTGAAFESFTIALDLLPSVLVARRLEGITFGLGASMLLSREALDAIGGFEAVADYLADDYQIGNRLWKKGYTIVLSSYVIEDMAGAMNIVEHLRHQLRWARTYRACRPKGFAGYGITYIFPISCLFFADQGPTSLALTALSAALVLRVCMALLIYRKVIRSGNWLRWLILLPLKDILSFGIWAWSFTGSTVSWRGSRYRILKGGKIKKI